MGINERGRSAVIWLVALCLGWLSVRQLLIPGGVVGLRHDWDIPAYSLTHYLERAQFAWERVNFGQPSLYQTSFLLDLLIGWLGKLGLPGGLFSQLIIIIAVGGALVSSYSLLRSLKLRFGPSLFGALFYIGTPLFFDKIVAGQLTYFLAYALLPLAILWFFKTQEALEQWPHSWRFVKSATIAGIMLGLVGIQSQFLVLLPTIYFLYICFFSRRKLRALGSILVIGGVASLLHGPWLLPLLLGSARHQLIDLAANAATLDWLRQLSTPLSPTLAILSRANPYYATAIADTRLQLLGQLLVGVGLLSVLLRPRRRVIFFTTVFIIGILLAKGTYPPFPHLFPFLFERVPGFVLFREVSHFLVLPAVSLSVLIGMTLDSLSDRLGSGRFIVYVMLLSILSVYMSPLLSGNFRTQVQVFVPPYAYKELHDQLKADPGDWKVLYLPTNQKSKFKDLAFAGTDPIISGSPKHPLTQEGNVVAVSNRSTRYRNHLLNLLHFGRGPTVFRRALSLGGIREVIFRSDFVDEFYRFTALGRYPSHVALWTNESVKRVLDGMFTVAERQQLGPITRYSTQEKSRIYIAEHPVVTAQDLSALEKIDSDLYLFADQNQMSELAQTEVVAERDELSHYVFSALPASARFDPSNVANQFTDAIDGFTRGVNFWWFDVAFTESIDPFVTSFKSDVLPFSMPVIEDGEYYLFIKNLKWPQGGVFSLQTDRIHVKINTSSDTTYWDIDNLGVVKLKAGEHLSGLVSHLEGKTAIGPIALVSAKQLAELTATSRAFIAEHSSASLGPAEIDSKKVNPTLSTISLTHDGPVWLVFTGSYDPDWELTDTSGHRYPHFVGNFYANAYYVTGQGEKELVLRYRRQSYYQLGLWLALLTPLVILGGIAFSQYRTRVLHRRATNSHHPITQRRSRK